VRTLDLTPRIIEFPTGSTHLTVRIEPNRYVAGRFIAELADAWKTYADIADLSPSSVSRQSVVIRNVGKLLTRKSDRSLTLHSRDADIADRLFEWEFALIEAYPPSSTTSKTMGRTLRIIVSCHLHTHRVTEGHLWKWATSPPLDGKSPRPRPLDEYSNSERLALEKVCRSIVRDTESRLALGRTLLTQGRDPRLHGWGNLDNVVWAVRHLPFDPTYEARILGKKADITVSDIDKLIHDEIGLHTNTRFVATEAGLLLAPCDEYLLAIRTLLHLQTGWSPEESRLLTREDVVFGDKDVRVRATKNRAQRIRWYTLASDAKSAPGWNAGDLLRRAAQSMSTGYALTPTANWFWTSGAETRKLKNTFTYPPFAVHQCTFAGGTTLGGLARRHGLEISAPHDMRRLRKTVKSARAVLIGTLSGGAGDDHSIEVFRGHYAHSTTVHTIAAQTVIRVQNKVLNRATQGPTLIEAAAADVASSTGDTALASIAVAVTNESPSDRELSITACSDPYSAPHNSEPSLCLDGPSMCLQCPNATVFDDHLPRLVNYHGILCDLRNAVPPRQFHEVYGQQLANLEAILEKFPTDKIDAAHALRVPIQRPLTEREQHR